MAKTNISSTTFGRWYKGLNRINKRTVLLQFKEAGISQNRVRAWMYKETLPKPDVCPIIEQITGKPLVELFPL